MRRASLCLMRPGSSRTRAEARTVSRGHALLGTPGVIAFALATSPLHRGKRPALRAIQAPRTRIRMGFKTPRAEARA